MATWEYSSLKLTLVFVFQKIGRQVQEKLTRWRNMFMLRETWSWVALLRA